MKKILLLMLCGLLTLYASAAVAVSEGMRPQVNNLTNPVGIGSPQPTFSWIIPSAERNVMQQSYRIMVASTAETLAAGRGDLWDSGDISSDQSNYVTYNGSALKSGRTYYWCVTARAGKKVYASPVQQFTMALLDVNEWKAMWIGRSFITDSLDGNTRVNARYLRKEFNLGAKVTRATLYICGLGLYKLYLNGQRIGEAELAPTPTDYNRSVRYNTYDVTSALQQGGNAIGVVLGNGRFTSMRLEGGYRPVPIPLILHFGLPQLLCQIDVETADGKHHTIVSDPSWKITADGPIGKNNEFDGELYNARKEMKGWASPGFNDAAWVQAEPVKAPAGELLAQDNPNIKVNLRLKPVSIHRTPQGKYILDMGQNMVGRLSIKLRGNEGDTLVARFAELMENPDKIYITNLRSAAATDTYISAGRADVWEPSFIYHGFRYVELSGFDRQPELADITGEVMYDEMAKTGEFVTSNDMINRLYHNAEWGIKGNYRGMPTDCPQRDERLGWLGDRTQGALGECYIFNNHLLYAKWMRDIRETMRPDTVISDVAPRYWDIYNDDVTWPSAWFTVTDMLYRQFGDSKPIHENYAAMKMWMEHQWNRYMKDGLLTHDTYGDWCMPPERPELIHSEDPTRKTDGSLLSTAFYYKLLNIMADFSKVLGNSDAAHWQQRATVVKDAFNRSFYNKEKGYYGNNTVTANLLPLRMGLMPEEYRASVVKHIIDKTENEFNGHISAGLIGVQHLMGGLTDNGRADLALKIATNKTYPSWGYMIEHGATTIWELWNGNTADPAMNSGNHVMLLGDLIIWFYNYLAGIGQQPESTGYKAIELRPRFIAGLDSVSASYHSLYGDIRSAWRRTGSNVAWTFTIPANTTARVCLPVKSDSFSKGNAKKMTREGKFVGIENGNAIWQFGSGTYTVQYAE